MVGRARLSGISFSASATKRSVSRLAVPLPMAIRSTPWRTISPSSAASDPFTSFFGGNGYSVAVATSLPVASTTAAFTPVRIPGSSPSVARGPAGAASSRSFRFRAKTAIASSWARRRNSVSRSAYMVSASLTRQVQPATPRSQSSPGALPGMPIAAATICSARAVPVSGSGAISIVTTSSFAARRIASARCEGIPAQLSAWSK